MITVHAGEGQVERVYVTWMICLIVVFICVNTQLKVSCKHRLNIQCNFALLPTLNIFFVTPFMTRLTNTFTFDDSFKILTSIRLLIRSSAIAEGPRDASCHLKSCQSPHNSAETTCTTSPEQIEVMKLEGYSGPMCNKHVHSTMTRSSRFHCLIGVIN